MGVGKRAPEGVARQFAQQFIQAGLQTFPASKVSLLFAVFLVVGWVWFFLLVMVFTPPKTVVSTSVCNQIEPSKNGSVCTDPFWCGVFELISGSSNLCRRSQPMV